MSPKPECSVSLEFSPTVPRTTAEALVTLIKACEGVAKFGRAYLLSGDLDDARRMVNAKLVLQTLGTKQQLPQMCAKIVGGHHPLDEGERLRALEALSTTD